MCASQNINHPPLPDSPEYIKELNRLKNLVKSHYYYWKKHNRASSELKYLTHKQQLEKQFGITHTPFQSKRTFVPAPVTPPSDDWFNWEVDPAPSWSPPSKFN